MDSRPETSLCARGWRRCRPLLLAVAAMVSTLFPAMAEGFAPDPSSVLGRRVHPRLHLTPETLPRLREAIARHYAREFQVEVEWAASQWNRPGILSEYRKVLEDPIVHWAFIGILGRVPGIRYPRSPEEFSRHAVESMMALLSRPTQVSYAAALVYDWAHHAMTPEERRQIGQRLRELSIPSKGGDQSLADPYPRVLQRAAITSSKYLEGCYAFYLGLALWGDGVADAEANLAVDSFRPVFLEYGRLKMSEFVAGKEGGLNELWGYARWHPRTHYLLVDAWRTATGENYFAGHEGVEDRAARTLAELLLYHRDPHPYFGRDFLWLRGGGAEAPELTVHGFADQLHLLGRVLAESGLGRSAGLTRYFVDTFKVTASRHESKSLWMLLGVLRSVPAIGPDVAGLRLSRWFRNLGAFVARTGFTAPSDSAFMVVDGHFNYGGHGGLEDIPGFTLAKFGELIGTREAATKGHSNVNDYDGGYGANVVFFEGPAGGLLAKTVRIDSPAELSAVLKGEEVGGLHPDRGGIEQVTRRDRLFYHVRVNRSRKFSGAQHTREYVWLPGRVPETDSDTLVVYDRTEAPGANITPRWVYHAAWRPWVAGSSNDVSSEQRLAYAYEGSNTVVVRNQPDEGEWANREWGVHGIAFVRTLLPERSRIELSRARHFNRTTVVKSVPYEIKVNAWQIGVVPLEPRRDHRFLHVFDVGDVGRRGRMRPTELVRSADGRLEGGWIRETSEAGSQMNQLVLFGRDEGIHDKAFAYTITGEGRVLHVVTGVKPGTVYTVRHRVSALEVTTEWGVSRWNYRGTAANPETGTLVFETEISGTTMFSVTPKRPAERPASAPGPFEADELP